MSHVHVLSSDPPLLRQRPGATPTELGHVEPEASGSHYFTSRVRTSRPFGGTQTSEPDSIYHRQQPALRTNRAAKINDEFWTPIAGQYQTFSTRCIVSSSADLSSVCCFFSGGGAVGGRGIGVGRVNALLVIFFRVPNLTAAHCLKVGVKVKE